MTRLPTRAQPSRALGQTVDITIEHCRSLADPVDGVQDWTVTANIRDLDPAKQSPARTVCRLELVKVPLGRPDHSDMLHWHHPAQLSLISDELLDDAGELREDHLDPGALFGGNALLVVGDIEIDPAYTGLGLDQMVALEAIALLGGGCDIAVTASSPTPSRPKETDHALDRGYWRGIGFEPATDQVMVLYLAHRTLDQNRHRLRANIGLWG